MRSARSLSLIALVALVMLLAPVVSGGCGPGIVTGPAALVAARADFNRQIHDLAGLRARGAFTPLQAVGVSEVLGAGAAALDGWESALELRERPGQFVATTARILIELRAIKKLAERRLQREPGNRGALHRGGDPPGPRPSALHGGDRPPDTERETRPARIAGTVAPRDEGGPGQVEYCRRE